MGIQNLEVFCDSQLLANQISGEYAARDDKMIAYLQVVKTLAALRKSPESSTLTRTPSPT